MNAEVEVNGCRVYLPKQGRGFDCKSVQQAHYLAGIIRDAQEAAALEEALKGNRRWQYGVLCRWGSAWMGAHWSPYNRRLCVNVLPCVTVWVALPGGKAP